MPVNFHCFDSDIQPGSNFFGCQSISNEVNNLNFTLGQLVQSRQALFIAQHLDGNNILYFLAYVNLTVIYLVDSIQHFLTR